MLKKPLQLLSILLLALPWFFLWTPVRAESSNTKLAPAVIEAKSLDKEAKILADYLAKHDSPLQYHAQDFVDAAKKYDLDWKLVPAIAGVESTFGKFTPGSEDFPSYNAWGWGAYDEYHAVYFKSWKEAIDTVSKGLRENYLDKGLADPYAINRVYAASPYWGSKVSYFLVDLDQFAEKYQAARSVKADIDPSTKIAALSGQLAFAIHQ